MEKGILIGFGIMLLLYFLLRYFNRQNKKEIGFSDILNNEKYKVKGQWDK